MHLPQKVLTTLKIKVFNSIFLLWQRRSNKKIISFKPSTFSCRSDGSPPFLPPPPPKKGYFPPNTPKTLFFPSIWPPEKRGEGGEKRELFRGGVRRSDPVTHGASFTCSIGFDCCAVLLVRLDTQEKSGVTVSTNRETFFPLLFSHLVCGKLFFFCSALSAADCSSFLSFQLMGICHQRSDSYT